MVAPVRSLWEAHDWRENYVIISRDNSAIKLSFKLTELQIKHNPHYLCYFCTKSYADHLLESSHWDDSDKWSNIEFGEKMDIIENKYAAYLEPWS